MARSHVRIRELLREISIELSGDVIGEDMSVDDLLDRVIIQLQMFRQQNSKAARQEELRTILPSDTHLNLSDWLTIHWGLDRRIANHLKRNFGLMEFDARILFDETTDTELFEALMGLTNIGPINAQTIIDARKKWREQEDI